MDNSIKSYSTNEEEKSSTSIETTLYEVNKQGYTNVDPMSTKKIVKTMEEVIQWLQETNETYYMLLCHERRDYTFFRTNAEQARNCAKEIIELLQSRGSILDIEFKDGAYRIWIRELDTKDNYMFMLFPADGFVIEVI